MNSSFEIYHPKPKEGKNPNLSFLANLSEPFKPKLNSAKYLLS